MMQDSNLQIFCIVQLCWMVAVTTLLVFLEVNDNIISNWKYMLWRIKSPLGLGFFLYSSMFQSHVSDSLCSQA